MATNVSVQNFPQLNGANFSNWKFRVECLLDEKGVKYVIEKELKTEEIERLPDKDKKELLAKDAKAKAVIVQCVTDKHIDYIKDAKSAYGMIICLKEVFERKTTLSKLYRRKQLLLLKCSNDIERKTTLSKLYRRKQLLLLKCSNDIELQDHFEKFDKLIRELEKKVLLLLKCSNDIELQDHFEKFDKLIRELESAGSKMDETDKVCHLLLTMTEKYQSVISARETTTMTLTIEFVKSRLLDYELKLNNEEHSSKIKNSECSLFNVNENRLRKCYTCGSTDHLKPNCPKNKNRNWNNRRGRNNYRNVGNRLGHLNRQGLKILGLSFSNEKCDSCMKGKAARPPFKNVTEPRSKRIGELTHSDICGPMFVPTLDNELYYMSVIDDLEYIEEMNAAGNRISRLRTDNGGEYTSKQFVNHCKRNGIKQEFTNSYTPQQAGVAERMNRTLLKTDLKKLKIFGSKGWMCVIPRENKLEPRGKEVRMVTTDKVILTRDVVFDESKYRYEMELKTISNDKNIQVYSDNESSTSDEQRESNDTRKR
ncbi:Zinc knuckle [Popillia japonica]|uniref:Zinc knuckle n=1 Tax=Popillia japonica TaxID=7064 RepID=A0AAW1N2D3_POPJA